MNTLADGGSSVPEPAEVDALIRNAEFTFLESETRMRGDVLPCHVLSDGFSWKGTRVPLLGPQGIFKPAVLPEMPLSIATAPEKAGRPRPYEDAVDPDGLLHGLKGFHGTRILVPQSASLRPNTDFLATRFELFKQAM
jgi:putative restriction endonuclease